MSGRSPHKAPQSSALGRLGRALQRPGLLAVAAASTGLATPAITPGAARPAAIAAIALAALVTLSITRGTLRLPAGAPPPGSGPAPPSASRSAHVLLVALLAFAGGVAIGNARLTTLDRFEHRVADGAPIDVRGHLLAHPRPGPLGASAELRLTSGPLRGARLLARLPRWVGSLDGTAIGSEVRLRGRLRSLARIAEDDRGRDFQFAAWLRRRGVAGELLADAVEPTGRRRSGVAGVLDQVRDRAEEAVNAGLSDDRGALLRGMVLGQDETIVEPVRDEFRASGLAHLLAVSGQNVMLLAALAVPALAAAGLGAYGRAVALLMLIAVYVPLAGAGPSLQRAGIMGAAGIAAMLAARPASRTYALLLAAALTLALNPRAIGDPGWQLSFAAVAGILAIGRPLAASLRATIRAALPAERPDATNPSSLAGGAPPSPPSLSRGAPPRPFRGPRATRVIRAAANLLADGVAITIAATLATAPLLAHHFGTVSIASLPANVLALPIVAPAMWLGMLKAAVGQLPLAGLPAGGLAAALGTAAALPLGVLATLAERFARLPAGQVRLPLESHAAVAAAYAFLVAALLAVRAARPRLVAPAGQAGARWRRLRRPVRLAIAALLGVLALLGTAKGLAPPRPPEALTVRFLDVGQGDATLIQDPDGTAILFDGGPPEAGVVRLLRRAGVRRLALVVATHPSRDHHGGLRSVLSAFDVDLLLDGGDGSADPEFRAVERAAEERGIRRIPAIAPLELRVGPLRVEVLSPPPRPPGPAPADPNPRATTAIVSAGAFDLLLSADAESPTLAQLPLPDVELMKLPHHGSADPGLPDLLERLRPEAAGITVGTNTYGHPAPSTLSALRSAGVPVWRTDLDGTISITIAGTGMHVETER